MKILFLDIETVPKVWNFNELDERTQTIFKKKFRKEIAIEMDETQQTLDNVWDNVWRDNAALHAEFCKIVCISFGEIKSVDPSGMGNNLQEIVYTKSLYNHDEKQLMSDFVDLMEIKGSYDLCAHNGKGFDFPVISRKILIHRLKLPIQLNIAGKKPWEISLIDTAELWRFGNFKDYASLDSMANCFGLPSPKETMDGSMVGSTYYGEPTNGDIPLEKNDALKQICNYCELGDVVTLVNVYRAIKGEHPIENVKSLTT